MQVRYGSYTHSDAECTVAIDYQIVRNRAGQPYAIDHTWTITGQLQAADTAAVVAGLRALELAYLVDGRDLTLFDASGTVCHSMPSAGSFTGVQIVKPPSYPEGTGAQLSTYRDYTIVATCRYPYGPGNLLKEFRETLAFSGGGPVVDVVECVNAPAQEQMLRQFSAYRATQTGSAVGLLDYPPIPAPIFGTPRVAGQPAFTSPILVNGVLTDWGVSWSYEFVSANPLVGRPNAWPSSGG